MSTPFRILPHPGIAISGVTCFSYGEYTGIWHEYRIGGHNRARRLIFYPWFGESQTRSRRTDWVLPAFSRGKRLATRLEITRYPDETVIRLPMRNKYTRFAVETAACPCDPANPRELAEWCAVASDLPAQGECYADNLRRILRETARVYARSPDGWKL